MARFALILTLLLAVAAAPARADDADLWATVNVCDTAAHPDEIGIRASMPGGKRGTRLQMRFRVQYRDLSTGRWRAVRDADSGWRKAGKGRPTREAGWSFEVAGEGDADPARRGDLSLEAQRPRGAEREAGHRGRPPLHRRRGSGRLQRRDLPHRLSGNAPTRTGVSGRAELARRRGETIPPTSGGTPCSTCSSSRTAPARAREEGTPEFDAEMKVWHALNEELSTSGQYLAASGLKAEAATTVRKTGGEVIVTDGPFAETKEILFSFYILDVADLDAAIAVGRQDARGRVRLGRHPPDGRGLVRVSAAAGALERAYRDERAAVLATITRRLDGDLALAEDVVQDAFVAAAVDWDRRGAPERPGAWLTTTAWRKALDRLRHDRVAAAYAPAAGADVTLTSSSTTTPRWTTTSCGCCSPAAIRRSRPRRGWR